MACEAAGSRWMVVQDLCEERRLPFVCVQPLVTHVAREQEDLTGDKTVGETAGWSPGWRGSCIAMCLSGWRGRGRSCGMRGGGARS